MTLAELRPHSCQCSGDTHHENQECDCRCRFNVADGWCSDRDGRLDYAGRTRPAPNDRKITLDLNEAKGTAILNYAAWDTQPAASLGPFAATFDSSTVTFDSKTGTRYDHYTINRITLDFTAYYSEGAPFDQAAPRDRVIYEYTCHVGKAQF